MSGYYNLEHALKETHSCACLNVESDSMTTKHKKTLWVTKGILRSINTRHKFYKKLENTMNSPNYIRKETNLTNIEIY